MSASGWLWSGLIALALAVLAAVYWRRRPAQPLEPLTASVGSELRVQPGPSAAVVEPARPNAIAFGSDPSVPVVTISPVTDNARFRAAKPIELGSGLTGRVGALMQAVPSLLIDNAHQGRHLMEVAIDGELVRAASGEGFRAFAVDAGRRITEHATLFDIGGLTKLVDAAAVWQVASVVVAQKHLADISVKLSVIAESVSRLSTFLDSARRAEISATYGYLSQVAQALRNGEFPSSVRDQLESCERDLLACQHHIRAEYLQRAQEPAKHDDTAGTGRLLENATKKFNDLESLASDMSLCLKTRALTWYVLSLYPGEPRLKLARRDDILAGVEELRALQSNLETTLEVDLSSFKAVFNWQSTLEKRKQEVTNVAAAARLQLVAGGQACVEGVSQTSALLLQHDKPTHLIFELQDGRVLQVRAVAPEGESMTTLTL